MIPIRNKNFIDTIRDAQSILLCTHILPDGDAIGSILALGRLLSQQGKNVTMVCHDPVPEKMRFLEGSQLLKLPADVGNTVFDLGFSVDVSTQARLGDAAALFAKCQRSVQLDHHVSNELFAMENEVDGSSAAAGCMVLRLACEMGWPVDALTAEYLYMAISTDTGNFCYANTDAEVFECMALLCKTGFDLNKVARNIHIVKDYKHVKLLGRALETLHLFAGGRCAGLLLRREDFEAVGADTEHAEGIVNHALNLPGVVMGYMIDESTPGQTRFSLRSVAPYTVNDIAATMGGGGHAYAAGCRTALSGAQVQQNLEKAMTEKAGEA